MEFKDYKDSDKVLKFIVLIESDWNLKFTQSIYDELFNEVLIESDWNLKFYCVDKTGVIHTVLIESDWNLKTILTGLLSISSWY